MAKLPFAQKSGGQRCALCLSLIHHPASPMADNDPTTTPAPPAAPAHPASPVYTVDGEALDVDAARRLSRNYELMKRERARGVRQGGNACPAAGHAQRGHISPPTR